MKIKQIVKSEKEVDIELPAFWGNNDHTEFIAAIDVETVIKITNRETYKSIRNLAFWLMDAEIADAYQNWNTISESEFIEIHEGFLQSLSLMPKMISD